jgi:hypothetical protein
MKMSNTSLIKTHSFGSLALALAMASPAFAGTAPGGGPGFSPVIEISVGGERSSTAISSPCAADCGGANRGKQARSGTLIRFGFKGINASELTDGNVGRYKVSFLPVSMTLDMSESRGDAFGQVEGYEGKSGRIRQVIGALVEGNYNAADGLVSLRGKLVRAEYNRDKGIWDWRALDAAVGIQGAVMVGGQTSLNIEVDVGGGIGGVSLNGMEDLSRALDVAPAMDGAYTLNPYAAIRTGLHSKSVKIELVASAEKRIDLTPKSDRSSYMGNRLDVDSVHANGTLEVEYTFGGNGLQQMGRRYSVFADLTYDFDTLTLSNLAFDSGDSYRSFIAMAGFRAQF